MNMPLVLLNRRRRGGAAAFTPAGLFALAEPGVWYDPSDLTTLFQDPAGTTPVTTPGQTVALALDKSKGLVLGSELVTNGDFSSGTTGWTAAVNSGNLPTLSLSSGRLRIATNEGTASSAYASITTVIGRTYSFSAQRFPVTPNSSLMTFAASTSTTTSTANFLAQTGTAGNTCVFVATGTTTYIHARISGTVTVGDTWEVDNISVKELPGFHATQATLASRPTYGIVPLGGRRNLLTRTEEFENAVWLTFGGGTKTGTNVAVAPNGTTTADSIRVTTADTGSNIYQEFTAAQTSSNTYTFSVWVRRNAATDQTFQLFQNIRGVTPFGRSGNLTATDTWQRFTLTHTSSGGTGASVFGIIGNTSGTQADLLVWGAQLETGSSATAYQRVGSAFDVTEAGVSSLSYLSFDGVDDFMVTPTITPGIDRAQVFAGVRKLSDAAAGTLVELSASAFSNAGSFWLFAPGNNGSPVAFDWVTRGNNFTAGVTPSVATYPAPGTFVLTGTGDIAADNKTLRVNGASVGTNTADQGTGNFLAYPLYIGRRAGTSLPFNGQIYSLLVRFGTNLDAGTITSTETWVGGKTGVTL